MTRESWTGYNWGSVYIQKAVYQSESTRGFLQTFTTTGLVPRLVGTRSSSGDGGVEKVE